MPLKLPPSDKGPSPRPKGADQTGRVTRMQTSRLCWSAALSAALIFPWPVYAHNQVVHQDMTDMAYEIMLMVLAREGRLISRPAEIDAAKWNAFLDAISDAVPKLRALPARLPAGKSDACRQDGVSFALPADWANGLTLGEIDLPLAPTYQSGSDCGIRDTWKPGGIFNEFNNGNPPDHTGLTLGFWAGFIDDQVCDTHLWVRPASGLGLGQLKQVIDEALDAGIFVLILPFVCLFDCIFGDCEACDEDAEDLADDANPNDDLEGLIPGVGDISGPDFVGMWHHINVQPSASNEFDDRQGLRFDEAEFDGVPDVVDFTLMAFFDSTGISLNYDDSLGTSRYQILDSDDGHPNTDERSKAEWQFPTVAHLTFEPVDNLGYYGWRKFRDEPGHPVEFLGWPLHAIGDAVSPMHIIASPAWGHRPFEDAQQEIWLGLRLTDPSLGNVAGRERLDQILQARRILIDAFRWREFILDWRSNHPGHSRDVPVRDLVTRVAEETYTYCLSTQGTDFWPFHPLASNIYLVDEGEAIEIYAEHPKALELGRPLVEKAMAAKIAFLASAAEVLP